MADFRPGGVKEVHRSETGTGGSWIEVMGDGDVTRSENIAAEPINQELTNGEYQSGDTSAPTFYAANHDNYTATRNLAVGANRAKQFFAVVFFDGTILKTSEAVFPKVWMEPKGVRSEGDSEWALSWNHHADEAWDVIASLT